MGRNFHYLVFDCKNCESFCLAKFPSILCNVVNFAVKWYIYVVLVTFVARLMKVSILSNFICFFYNKIMIRFLFVCSTDGSNTDLMAFFNITNLSNAFVECTFFQPEYTCTIDYGTDSTYTNLVYRDTSSTQRQMTSIILTHRLREGTTYYYIVSVESSSHCVRLQGRFQTGRSITLKLLYTTLSLQ